MADFDVNKKISENMIIYRKLNGLTQAELAECIGYSNKSVSKWERGEGVPDISTLLSISEVMGITVSELIGQTEMSKDTAEKIKSNEKNKKNEEKSKKKALERAKKLRLRKKKKKESSK